MSGNRHGWNDLEHYLNIHEACLRDFEHFIERNTISFQVAGPSTIFADGRLSCAGGTYLDVRKTLELNDRNQVRTIRYSYHAGMSEPVNRAIFRYDNAHAYTREGHADEHHKHRFDVGSGTELRPPEWIGRDGWPVLREVVAELEDWWLNVGQLLNEEK